MNKFLEFARNQQKSSHVMTQARIQPLCRADNTNIGYYSGRIYFLGLLLKEIKQYFYILFIFV